MSDGLDELWACLSCFSKFRAGKLRTGGGFEPRTDGNTYGLNCPECRSMMVHPIGRAEPTTVSHQNQSAMRSEGEEG